MKKEHQDQIRAVITALILFAVIVIVSLLIVK